MVYIPQTKIFFLLMILLFFSIQKSFNKEIQLNNRISNENENTTLNINGKQENYTFGNYYELNINHSNKTNIQIETNNTFNFLTYEVVPNYGKINVSICKNPFCNSSENNDLIIKGYKSYFYTIKNNNEKKNLVIKCFEGIKDDIESKCIAKINIYTDNDNIYMNKTNNNDIILYKYISKNNINNYCLDGTNSYLYINLFSGNISLNNEDFNNSFYFENINSSKNLIIEANEDSFYSIILNNYKNNIEDSFIIGSYYLFNTQAKVKLIDNFYY